MILVERARSSKGITVFHACHHEGACIAARSHQRQHTPYLCTASSPDSDDVFSSNIFDMFPSHPLTVESHDALLPL